MDTLVGPTVSHDRILEQVGGGGMGVVYKAQDLELDRLVTLKFIPPHITRDPEAKQRFIHEAKAAPRTTISMQLRALIRRSPIRT